MQNVIATHALSDIIELKSCLEKLVASEESGSLNFSNHYITKQFNFKNGHITGWSTSNKGRQIGNLGFALLQVGLVSSKELLDAFMGQRFQKKHYCEILCENKLITHDDIHAAAIHVVSEEICEVFTWDQGKYEISGRQFPSTPMYEAPYLQNLQLIVPISLILETLPVYLENWKAVTSQLNQLQMIIVMNNSLAQELQEYIDTEITFYDGVKDVVGRDRIFDTNISQRLQKDLAYFNGYRCLKEIVNLISSDRLNFCKLVLDLIHRDYLRPLEVKDIWALARHHQKVKDLQEAKKYYRIILAHPDISSETRREIEHTLLSLDMPRSDEDTQVMPSESLVHQPVEVMPLEHLVPGYDIVEEIGKGAIGRVYKARQKSLRRFVAIKVVPSIFFLKCSSLNARIATKHHKS